MISSNSGPGLLFPKVQFWDLNFIMDCFFMCRISICISSHLCSLLTLRLLCAPFHLRIPKKTLLIWILLKYCNRIQHPLFGEGIICALALKFYINSYISLIEWIPKVIELSMASDFKIDIELNHNTVDFFFLDLSHIGISLNYTR